VYRATEHYAKIKPSDIEFKLPQPNYTVHTLAHISDIYADKEFCLIMGEDNLKNFYKWKNYETILEHHHIYVYPRIADGNVDHQFKNHPKIHKVTAPIVQISSTMIRRNSNPKKHKTNVKQRSLGIHR
jgi:nicotinate-nucleotide adenylyltransferase